MCLLPSAVLRLDQIRYTSRRDRHKYNHSSCLKLSLFPRPQSHSIQSSELIVQDGSEHDIILCDTIDLIAMASSVPTGISPDSAVYGVAS